MRNTKEITTDEALQFCKDTWNWFGARAAAKLGPEASHEDLISEALRMRIESEQELLNKLYGRSGPEVRNAIAEELSGRVYREIRAALKVKNL